MSALAADLHAAWVHLELDTRAPKVVVEAADRVEPPDALVALIRADEPLGHVTVWVRDSKGQDAPLGYEVEGDLVRLVVPTVGLPTGEALISVVASDLVCNTAAVEHPVFIDRPRAFDVALHIVKPLAATLDLDGAYEVATDQRRALEVAATLDGAFETEIASQPALHVSMGVHREDE